MKRRDLLKTAAIAGVGASMLGTPGCATVPRAPTPRDDHAADAYLAMLDKSLALASEMRPVHEFAAKLAPGERTPEQQTIIETNDRMFQRLLRTLFVTQSFRDLPAETQTHPAVQQRIASHLDEVDTTVFDLTNFLSSRTTEERTRLRDAMKQRPRAAMDIAQELDARAATMGVSKQRRRQLRQMMSQATFRMRTEAPGALIDEYTTKVERLRGADGRNALALELAQKLGERQFWRYQRIAQADAPATASTRPPSLTPQQQPAQPVEAGPKPGSVAIKAGAYMMGIGVLDFGVGALIVSNVSEGALFDVALVGGITIGSLLVAIGFVVLIFGALIQVTS